MTKDIAEIMNFLLPEHLKSENPVLTELFNIFLRYINENAYDKIVNISNLVTSIQEQENKKYTEYRYKEELERKNLDLKFAFINLFAQNINEFFTALKSDKEIDSKLTQYAELLGLEKSSLYDVSKLDVNINEEVIACTKDFAQLKGTNVPFDFLANLVENDALDPGIVPIGDIDVTDYIDFDTQLPVPLKYNVESSVHAVVFNKAIKPLVHPVGFEVIYSRILKLLLEDHFNLRVENYGYNIQITQYAGKTLTFADKLDIRGNVANKLITSFKSFINEHGIEELDIKLATGERIYRIANGDIVYYDKKKIPHKFSKKFYNLSYTFKKRITPTTKDKKYDIHTSYLDDEYKIACKINGNIIEVLFVEDVRDFYERLDHVEEEKSLEDIQTYIEPFGSNDDKDLGEEKWPEFFESRLGIEKTIWLNNAKVIGDFTLPNTFKLGDKVKFAEDEDLFWANTDYYVDFFIKILRETETDLTFNEDMLTTYNTREGRRRIGKWKGFTDPRKEEDTRDVPNLTGDKLRAKINELKALIYQNKKDITYITSELNKVLSSREDFYFLVEGEHLKDSFDLVDKKEDIVEPKLSDTMNVTDRFRENLIVFDMSNNDGYSIGNTLGKKPLGNEDTVSTSENAGISTYTLINGEFKLTDYLSFKGDDITQESDTIQQYQSNILECEDNISRLENEISLVKGVWGVYQRTVLRSELNEWVKAKSANQLELDLILNKYI